MEHLLLDELPMQPILTNLTYIAGLIQTTIASASQLCDILYSVDNQFIISTVSAKLCLRSPGTFVPPFQRATMLGLNCTSLPLSSATISHMKLRCDPHEKLNLSRFQKPGYQTDDFANFVLLMPLVVSQLDINSNFIHLKDPRPSSGLEVPSSFGVGITKGLELQLGSVYIVPGDLSGFFLGVPPAEDRQLAVMVVHYKYEFSSTSEQKDNKLLVSHVGLPLSAHRVSSCSDEVQSLKQQQSIFKNDLRYAQHAFSISWMPVTSVWTTYAMHFPRLCRKDLCIFTYLLLYKQPVSYYTII